MTENWVQWQGEVVDGAFRLDRYLGGSEHSGVFATEFGGQKAVIKLRAGEARIEPGTELSHPHLLRILNTGRWEREGTALTYMVMEHADEVLSNFIPARALGVEEARETLAPVLDALAYLHGRGVVHGRVKPSNIMSVGERLKISSDGLRQAGEEGRLAGVRRAYDAPEISDGRLTEAADVWSVGVTVVEMVTQQLPVLNGRGNPVLPAAMPEVFREIASHCLQQDPQQRWSVVQIAERLAGRAPARPAMLAAKPATADEPRAPGNRKTTAVVAGVAAVAIVVAGALLLRPRPAVEAPAAPPPVATQEPAPAAPAAVAPATPSEEKRAVVPAQRVRGKVEHAVEPDVLSKARGTIQGHVRVRITVQVDSSGKVVETKLDTPRVSRYFATAALQAARRWRFAPPMEDGAAVASSWVLEFDFGRGGTQMHSRQR